MEFIILTNSKSLVELMRILRVKYILVILQVLRIKVERHWLMVRLYINVFLSARKQVHDVLAYAVSKMFKYELLK